MSLEPVCSTVDASLISERYSISMPVWNVTFTMRRLLEGAFIGLGFIGIWALTEKWHSVGSADLKGGAYWKGRLLDGGLLE